MSMCLFQGKYFCTYNVSRGKCISVANKLVLPNLQSSRYPNRLKCLIHIITFIFFLFIYRPLIFAHSLISRSLPLMFAQPLISRSFNFRATLFSGKINLFRTLKVFFFSFLRVTNFNGNKVRKW